MKFETDYIEKLARVLADTGLTEISLEDGEQAITLRKDVIVTSAPVMPATPAPVEKSTESTVAHKGNAITSPMVGTFYAASSPEAAPFVTEGKTISKGDVVCIVEAMKLMNEIESEFSGTVTEICVKDGQPVEYGQVLMYVE